MKRILVMALCAVMVMTFVGCGKKQGKGESEGDLANSISGEVYEVSELIIFGKIKKVVGNEIELEIAKDPHMGGDGIIVNGDEGETVTSGESSESGDEGILESGDMQIVESVTITESAQAADTSDGSAMLEMMEQEEQKLELDYVGETKNLTIPTGIKIFNLKTGKDVNVSELKSGSVIRIYADGTVESPTISNIDILE